MTELDTPDLTLPTIPYGTHQARWDLSHLLYADGARTHRRDTAKLIESGALGAPQMDRFELVVKLHSVIAGRLAYGRTPNTIGTYLEEMFRFWSWSETNSRALTLPALKFTFLDWSEALHRRAHILKEVSEDTAHKTAWRVADLVARILDWPHPKPGRALMRLTRLRHSPTKKRVLGTQAEKESLEKTFTFGKFLSDICDGLTIETVRGELPARIQRADGSELVVACNLDVQLDPSLITKPSAHVRAARARAPLGPDTDAVEHRAVLINLRIEAELLIFISQTGMNLAQAAFLIAESYRWQSDVEDTEAIRAYKGRRHGDVLFRCFKVYRAHLNRYISWLQGLGLYDEGGRLFPFVRTSVIPATHQPPSFSSVRRHAAAQGVAWTSPRALRGTRVNWLLRRSKNPKMTSVMHAHTEETLHRNYERPHYQLAAVEITKFHREADPSITPPGPGRCVGSTAGPAPVPNLPVGAPAPDCISPDGCLFCQHHRDILSEDYCWNLASHTKLKIIEMALYRPPKQSTTHPATHVINRMEAKLKAIQEGSEVRKEWVVHARDSVRSGRYHPAWDGFIRLAEMLG